MADYCGLIDVDGQEDRWDNHSNLLDDETRTFTYGAEIIDQFLPHSQTLFGNALGGETLF